MILNRSLAIAAITLPLAGIAFWVAWDWTYNPSPMIVEDTHPFIQFLVSACAGCAAALLVGAAHWLWTKSTRQHDHFFED
jgi:hypothetical protein